MSQPTIDAAEIARRRAVLFDVFGGFAARDERPDGYAMRYPATDAWRERIALAAEIWRRGYPTLAVEVGDDPVPTLTVTGPDGTKAFLRDLAAVTGRAPAWQRASDLAGRIATAPLRVLPNALLIGAAKCGTTSLYAHLAQHPSFAPARTKEIYFFTNTFRANPARRTTLWYRTQFPTVAIRARIRRATGAFVTAEATPCYLFDPLAPARVRAVVPDAKLIVLVRDPVAMAYSFYQMKLRGGIETLSFEDALDAEEARTAGERERLTSEPNHYSVALDHFAYRARARYAEQLDRWLEHFPRERIAIFAAERYKADPAGVVRDAQAFLGLDARPTEPHAQPNSGGPYAPMAPATRDRLRDYFRPFNERLYAIAGEDFGW